MKRAAILIGATAGMIGVIAGAFGAHGLKAHVTGEMLEAWRTGVEYQMYHALALLVISRMKVSAGVVWLFTAGMLMFSGSLYVMVLTNAKWVGPITPIGGVCFIVGWAWLIVGAMGKEREETH